MMLDTPRFKVILINMLRIIDISMARRILIVLIAIVIGAFVCLAFMDNKSSEMPVDILMGENTEKELPPILDVEVENFSIISANGYYECITVLRVTNPSDCNVSIRSIDIFVSDENGNPICTRKIIMKRQIPGSSMKEITFGFSIPASHKGFLVFEGFIHGKACRQEAIGTFRKIVQI